MITRPLVVLVGPTAVGKTEVALQMARDLNLEIISADSLQVYRFMDIGTAKPTPKEREGVPYHLIDIVNPDEEFSVARFKEEAERIIEEIYERKGIPLLVGGTGLYIRAVIDGLFPSPPADWSLRRRLKEEADKFGNQYLYQRLKEVDSQTASKLHPHDLRRIIRALEVYEQTGAPISYWQSKTPKKETGYNLAMIGLRRERKELYERINQRVEAMIKAGLIEEVKKLLARGYREDLISLQGLGYKHLVAFLRGKCDLEEALRLFKRDTRRYAKRQMTWFKKDKRIFWIGIRKEESLRAVVEKVKKVLANKLKIGYDI